MRFPRQEYWSGLPYPSPGDLPDPGIQPASSALTGEFFATEPPGKPPPRRLDISNFVYLNPIHRRHEILCWLLKMGDTRMGDPYHLQSHAAGFSNSHVWMWELDYKESWALKKWCFWTVVLEKTLESLLDCKEIQPVNPNGNQSWIFIGRTDAEAETLVLWPPDAKNWLIWKDPDAAKDWRWEKKGTTEDGWHHRLDGHEFEQALGIDRQGNLACCRPRGHKESDTTEQLNWTESRI